MNTPLDLLETALHDSDTSIRSQAIRTLAKLGSPAQEAIPFLKLALRDEDALIRRRAAQALAQLGTLALSAFSDLWVAWLDGNWVVREAVVDALWMLARLVADESPPSGNLNENQRAVFLESFQRASHAERVRMVRVLTAKATRVESAGLLLLATVLHDSQPVVRDVAARGLASLHSAAPFLWIELAKALRHPHPSRQRRAVRALAWYASQTEEVLPLLKRALRDAHARVRRAAVQALAWIDPCAVPLFPELLRRFYDEDNRVQTAAAEVLDELRANLPYYLRIWLELLAKPKPPHLRNSTMYLAQPSQLDPIFPPERALRAALAALEFNDAVFKKLPESVKAEFIRTCARRVAWHQFHARGGAGASAMVERMVREGRMTAADWAGWAVDQAERSAVRHLPEGKKRERIRIRTRNREYAWQCARLFALIQRHATQTQAEVPEMAP